MDYRPKVRPWGEKQTEMFAPKLEVTIKTKQFHLFLLNIFAAIFLSNLCQKNFNWKFRLSTWLYFYSPHLTLYHFASPYLTSLLNFIICNTTLTRFFWSTTRTRLTSTTWIRSTTLFPSTTLVRLRMMSSSQTSKSCPLKQIQREDSLSGWPQTQKYTSHPRWDDEREATITTTSTWQWHQQQPHNLQKKNNINNKNYYNNNN